MSHVNHTAKWQIFSTCRVAHCWGKQLRTTLMMEKYTEYFCVFVCCLLFTVLSFIYIPVHFLLSFSLILSPVQIMKVGRQHGCWHTAMPAVSISGRLVSTNHSLFSGPTGGAWGWHVLWRRWDIWRRTWGMAMPGVVVRWLLSSKNVSKCQQHDPPMIWCI